MRAYAIVKDNEMKSWDNSSAIFDPFCKLYRTV